MVRIFVGFTVFLAMFLLPLGHLVAFFIVDAMQGSAPPALWPVTKLIFAYVAGGVIAWLFIKKAKLSRRIPNSYPGATLLVVGAALNFVVPAMFFVAHHFLDFDARTTELAVSLAYFPGAAVMLCGGVRVLLSAANQVLEGQAE